MRQTLSIPSRLLQCLCFVLAWSAGTWSAAAQDSPPNIILIMSDDQGWGDVGYNGNTVAHTPALDRMAQEGLRLDRFYAASPVCSPTRGSVLTGRHPFRYGMQWAGEGHLPAGEITIAEALSNRGYSTGHFGKWHVGELSRTVNQSYFAGELAEPARYSPPWKNGFDVSFSTESMMPTYNPYYHLGGDYGSEGYRHLQTEAVLPGQREGGFRWRDHYWTGPGEIVDDWLQGDDSALIVDRALTFIEEQISNGRPFLTLVWFHTPHTPLVAGNTDRSRYAKQPMAAQHWYGAIEAMDRQVGRLRQFLRQRGVADNTILWFKSDNGPSYIHDYNSAGPFSGKKGTLKEGGIRVPAIIEWPARLGTGGKVSAPLSTSDIFPTLLAATGTALPTGAAKLDGENILPLLQQRASERGSAIAFQSPVRGARYDADHSRLQYALEADRFKLYSGDSGDSWQLYDLLADPGETRDLSREQPDVLSAMRQILLDWVADTASDSGPGHARKTR